MTVSTHERKHLADEAPDETSGLLLLLGLLILLLVLVLVAA